MPIMSTTIDVEAKSSAIKSSSSTYYDKGSTEVATETALTISKLERRRHLTPNSSRLVIALVGLPGRGKSFVARKLVQFLNWRGEECKIFNVGKYRRNAHAESLLLSACNSGEERETLGACHADFFDNSNKTAAAIRKQVAAMAMDDMLNWLHSDGDEQEALNNSSHHRRFKSLARENSMEFSVSSSASNSSRKKDRIAIFDATNSTAERRGWILEQCNTRKDKPTGVVFVESICDDQELLEANFRFKVSNSPDFKGMSQEEALSDLRKRVEKYEQKYETIKDDSLSYIKIYNLSSKIMVNQCYGRMTKTIVPALMAWNIGTRPIFLCRPGMTPSGVFTDEEDYVASVNANDPEMVDMSRHSKRKSIKGNKLGPKGVLFRSALEEFIRKEGMEFMERRAQAFAPTMATGTSQTGLQGYREIGTDGRELPFHCAIMSSTMPRAVQTGTWDDLTFQVEQLSSLNPLDKGDFAGMELEDIRTEFPDWYAQLQEDPFHTRFPGGECYCDLISRLESSIIDMEQQTGPVVVVSHVSVLQVLIAYFRNTPVEKSVEIEVPMQTVLKFTPVRGGGWSETQHTLLEERDDQRLPPCQRPSDSDLSTLSDEALRTPIWGDHNKSRKRITIDE